MINLYSGKVKPRRVFPNNHFILGISKYDKGGDTSGSFAFSRGVDIHANDRELQILPASVKESGSTTQGLPVWGEHIFSNVFFLDTKGNIYQRNYAGSHALLHTAPTSRGNGLAYYAEDFYLYYMNNTTIGRYGPFADDQVTYETWANGIDITKWNNWGGTQVTSANRFVTITSTLAPNYYGLEQVNYNLTGTYIASSLVSVGSRTIVSWEVYPCYANLNKTNQLFWYIDYQNNLKIFKKVAGVNTTIATGTYNPAVHRYFRIREASGTIFYDYSTDYANWINFGSVANPFAVTSMLVGMFAGTFSTEVTTSSASFGLWATGVTTTAPQFVDDYFGSQGGVPTNTAQLNLVAASSQSVSHADNAALDIISDLAIEIYVTPTSLPAVGSSMTLVGKWDEATNHRSYKFDILSVSGYFGTGSDGALTIATNTTDSPIDSACSGTTGANTLSATNASFAAGQEILIIQMQGANAGQKERNVIQAYTSGTITLGRGVLKNTYLGVAQVIVLKQYTTITVNAGITWTAKAWNGTTGGIIGAIASGTLSGGGAGATITGLGLGFRGGANGFAITQQGEGTAGLGRQSTTDQTVAAANGNGAGGATNNGTTQIGANGDLTGGGVGGAAGGSSGINGSGGTAQGSADGTLFVLGGGGSAGEGNGSGAGGNGGASALFIAANIDLTNLTLNMSGAVGQNWQGGGNNQNHGGGAGGAGCILLQFQTITAPTANTLVALGGVGGSSSSHGNNGVYNSAGGNGGNGRVALNYLSFYTVATTAATPNANITQDNTLVAGLTYQLRLGISDNGTSAEYLTINTAVPIGVAQRYGVSWKASLSQATFYVSGKNIGVTTGAKTAISNNASAFIIGANNGGSGITNYFDGQVDDVRLWNATRTDAQMLQYLNTQMLGNEANLVGYWKFNSTLTDATSSANTLTNNGGATFSSVVPFPAPTTRTDMDQSFVVAQASTYSVPTTLTEADKQTFVPLKDPQKSIDLDIAATGGGDWTIVVHNGLNQVVASVTVPNAQLHTGFMEFIYPNAFRPVVGATYHFHVYSSAGSGTINTSLSADPTTIRFHTYYQFLINDLYHPGLQMASVLGIGNERYLAVQDAAGVYNNQRLRFPGGWHVRCLAIWRNFYAIGCWKGSNITDFDQGIIFFWDGFSITYNDFIYVPQGGINAMAGLGDKLYFIAGYQGKIMEYDGSTAPRQVRQIPKMDRTTNIEVLPGAMTVWQNMVRIGVALQSNNSNVQRGVYSFGNNFGDEPEALTMDYVISTGNYDSTVQVGVLFPANTNLLVGWNNNNVYGMDVIMPTGNPAPSATIEGNIIDQGMRWKEKLGLLVRADFKPLKTGETVKVKYRFGYNNAWVIADTSKQVVGDTNVRLNILAPAGNHHEFQVGVDMSQTNNTSPTILEYGMYEDLLITEDENPY